MLLLADCPLGDNTERLVDQEVVKPELDRCFSIYGT